MRLKEQFTRHVTFYKRSTTQSKQEQKQKIITKCLVRNSSQGGGNILSGPKARGVNIRQHLKTQANPRSHKQLTNIAAYQTNNTGTEKRKAGGTTEENGEGTIPT